MPTPTCTSALSRTVAVPGAVVLSIAPTESLNASNSVRIDGSVESKFDCRSTLRYFGLPSCMFGRVGFGHRGFGVGDHETGTLRLAPTLPAVASWPTLANAVRSLWLRLERRDGWDR